MDHLFVRMKAITRPCYLGLLLSCLSGGIFAQTSFQKRLDAFLPAPHIRAAPDGQSCYVADVASPGGPYRLQVYRFDMQGQVLWHLEQVATEPGLQIKSMVATNDGILLLVGAESPSVSNSYLIKIYENGSLAWKRQIGTPDHSQAFDLESDETGRLFLSGLHLRTLTPGDSAYYYLAQLDSAGTPIESRENFFRYLFTGREKCRYTDLTWNYASHTLMFVEDFKEPYTQSFMNLFNRERFSVGYCTQEMDFDERITPFEFEHLEHADTLLFFSGWTLGNDFYDPQPVVGRLTRNGQSDEVLKRTPTIYRPLSARSADLVFYIPAEQSLVQLDASLQIIWKLKLDNCLETTTFEGDVSADGSIYCVRNIKQHTIVARISRQGALPSCAPYLQTPVALSDTVASGWYGLSPSGYPEQQVPVVEMSASFVSSTLGNSDFCGRLDAGFEVPEVICLDTELVPTGVDTMAGLRHTWNLDSREWTDSIPELDFPVLGMVQALHRVENDICSDTAIRQVKVLPRPYIGLSDTLVCGPSEWKVNLGGRGAERYFLDGIQVASNFSIDHSGIFTLRLENDGCFVEMPLSVRIVAFDPPILPLDTAFCYGDSVAVRLRDDFRQVYWDGIAASDSFIISDALQHRYQAQYIFDTSCIVEGVFSIPRVRCDGERAIYVPNVFSPETGVPFQVFPTSIAGIVSLRIYDRWGSMVFADYSASPLWDGISRGQPALSGVYVYQIEYRDFRDDGIKIQAGDVLLVRK